MVRQVRMGVGLAILLLSAACASAPASRAPSGSSGSSVGAAGARNAVEAFMAAVNKQDLQAMGSHWGTAKGPARDLFKRDELEKRLIVMQCLLAHDSWKFAEQTPRLSTGGRHEFLVELRKNRSRAQTTFVTVMGPQERWYVEIIDVAPLRDFCR